MGTNVQGTSSSGGWGHFTVVSGADLLIIRGSVIVVKDEDLFNKRGT
jgi:hypothetical protein